ncbi:MAG: TatD family hydrolase [Actinobacteria bacterium]|nr:TatD family hydrolase [Actinomycetota bacterium]
MDDGNPPAKLHGGAVDTHCHLFLLEDEPRRVLERARAAGVNTVVCVGIDPKSSRRSVELAESLRGVFATAGMHPHTASDLDARAGAVIEELLANPQVVGVGETGLDFYRMLSPQEDQERALRTHIALSRETGKPLVVHVREAWPAVLQLLDEGSVERAVMHCFSGDAETARECAARGYYLSFAGNVTYPRNHHLRDAAAATPIDRLLAETDSPFLAPQSLRGRDNHPANIAMVIEELARVRGESIETVRDATRANARAVFSTIR